MTKRKNDTMISTVESIFVCESGTTVASPFRAMGFEVAAGKRADAPAGPNALERLVQIVKSNDRLTADLEAARSRIVRARAALEAATGSHSVEMLYLDHCKTKHRGILAQLRANRIEAQHILGETGSRS